VMGKSASKKLYRDTTSGQFLGRGIAGMTADGVVIRKSPGRATHFTQREVEKAVAAVLTARSQGSDGTKKTQHKKG